MIKTIVAIFGSMVIIVIVASLVSRDFRCQIGFEECLDASQPFSKTSTHDKKTRSAPEPENKSNFVPPPFRLPKTSESSSSQPQLPEESESFNQALQPDTPPPSWPYNRDSVTENPSKTEKMSSSSLSDTRQDDEPSEAVQWESSSFSCASSFCDLGQNISTRLAQGIGESLEHNCLEVDTLLRIVKSSHERTLKALRHYAKQGYDIEEWGTGYLHGFKNVFKSVSNRCRSECSTMGKMLDEIAADTFCEISIAIGQTARISMLEQLLNIGCGEPYSTICESIFYTEAKARCPHYATGGAFERYYRSSHGGVCSSK